jgi:hypothetical protein
MQKELQLKTDYAAVGEEITPALAASFVKSFVEAHPEEIPAFHIGRNIIDQILAQPGCCGMRFYNGINEMGRKTLVYVAIDKDGKDLSKMVIAENGALVTCSSTFGDRTGEDLIEIVKRLLGF